MKRFTETNKWDDPWFRGLSGVQKLMFLYIIDRCNNAGFWEVDEDGLMFQTKLQQQHVKGAWEGLARGLVVKDGWVWIRRFLRHQKNEVLSTQNPAHKQIICLLKDQLDRFHSCPEFIEFINPHKGLLSPIGKGIGNGNGNGRKESAERKPPESTPLKLRLGALFSRRESTEWSEGEEKSFRKLELSDDDLAAIERYYKSERAKGEKGIHRRDLSTFLRNATGELDRAKASRPKNGKALEWPDSRPKIVALPDPAEDERLRAEAKRHAEQFRKGLA